MAEIEVNAVVDLRSDTVTRPTAEMRQAMATARVGDDVYDEDPTVRTLQERAAEIFEREAALFVPSGTMGNQIAVKLHTTPGQEVITEANSHIFNYELAMIAAFSGCLARPVQGRGGHLGWKDVEAFLSPAVYYRAPTGLITLENTHNFGGGSVLRPVEIQEICRNAHQIGLPVHLDGARIFNAAAALQTGVAQLTRGCDSVMFCLSKGLSAPVGSLLVGTRDFITEARRIRKMLGGGMRQVGILAAAGLIALEKMPDRLPVDHENARFLAESIAEFKGLQVNPESVETNIVLVGLPGDSQRFLKRLHAQGVLAGPASPRQIRFVTHKDVSRRDVETAVRAIEKALQQGAD